MGWRGAMALGVAFMAIIVYEFAIVSDAAMATQYGLTMRLMTGFHFLHALAILAIMLRVYRKRRRGHYSGDERMTPGRWKAAAKLMVFCHAGLDYVLCRPLLDPLNEPQSARESLEEKRLL